MTTDLDSVWREARLWPADATSYLDHLRKTGTAIPAEDVHDANLNMTASSARYGLANLRSKRSDALLALCRTPVAGNAEEVYRWLLAYPDDTSVGDAKLAILFSTEPSLRIVADSFLWYVIQNSPHKVAIQNSMALFADAGEQIDADVLRRFCADPFLVQFLYPLVAKTPLSKSDADPLIFVMAQRENYDAQEHLYQGLTAESPIEVRRFLLRHAQFAVEPVFETYNGFDQAYNPEYHPGLLEFAQRTHLESELCADTIDNELVSAALSFFEALGSCWLEDVPWSAFEEVIPARDMFCRLLGHLQGRALSLEDMSHLAQLFETLFREPLSWVQADPQKVIDDQYLIGPQDLHIRLGQQISGVFEFAANREKMEAALSSDDNRVFDEAIRILVWKSSADRFDLIYPFLQKALPRGTRPPFSASVLSIFFGAATTADKAEKAANWCIDYCRFERTAGFSPGPGYEYILMSILRVIKRFPGIGKSLIVVGLGAASPARDLAVEALRDWPLEHWPEGLLWRLDSALKKHEHSMKLLEEIRQKLLDAGIQ